MGAWRDSTQLIQRQRLSMDHARVEQKSFCGSSLVRGMFGLGQAQSILNGFLGNQLVWSMLQKRCGNFSSDSLAPMLHGWKQNHEQEVLHHWLRRTAATKV